MGYKNDFSKEEVREKIFNLLMSTGREGISNLFNHMDKNGFFTAPCSGGNHLSKEGGLAEHSLNVYNIANDTAVTIFGFEEMCRLGDSIIIAALLHDLGKIGQFEKPLYVENILQSGKRSTAKPYAQSSDLLKVDHEVVSVVEASRFIQLTEEEQFAILYHNGMYVGLGRSLKDNETPLQILIHFADMWASRVTEEDGESND
ncbi:HD domain-containing protein [Lachnoclostridium phytofermentans]|uniref:Metal dependent phosphohydrolase n=1 Tax=Lachnoclostridium phytofermentans (strain ATCC 700394 / DSM 18823 / ISDg) TaxID=357809 RepID=A9KQ36_LACP7|nr:HD domain-containing protein [Lachnoclostridium phytofermentans]ABX43348.1 metal dependent phosphohydrolase [Lachnoclostridium phytofermentans ISDg]